MSPIDTALRLGAALCFLSSAPTFGADKDDGIPFPIVGKIRPRLAREITASNWSVGAEKLDRDFTDYENWKFLATAGRAREAPRCSSRCRFMTRLY